MVDLRKTPVHTEDFFFLNPQTFKMLTTKQVKGFFVMCILIMISFLNVSVSNSMSSLVFF